MPALPNQAIVEVDFPYDAEVVRKGFRNPEKIAFLSRTAVAIRRVDPAALVPVIELADACMRPFDDGARLRRPATVFAAGDGLWTPLLAGDESPLSATDFAEQMASGRSWLQRGNPFRLDREHIAVPDAAFRPFRTEPDRDFPEARIEDVPLRRLISSRREEAAADAQRVADALLIAGDVVMYRCHEPFWCALPHKDDACLVFGAEDATDERFPFDTFRADRRADMLEWRRRWADEAEGGSPKLTRVRGEAKVLVEGHLRRDDLRFACRGMDHIANRSFDFFRTADADVLMHWATLRDRSNRLTRTWDRDEAMAALDSLAVLRGAFAHLPVRGIHYSRHEFEIQHTACRRLLARAHWYEGWSNALGVELDRDDEAAILAMDPLAASQGAAP